MKNQSLDQELEVINLTNQSQCNDIIFEDLKFEVPIKGGTYKQILKGVSGEIKSEKLTAIMGPTGSGKTSLLNTLACRVEFTKNAIFTGKIYHNKSLRNEDQFVNKIAYVMQEDILYAFLTVKETLTFAANFYLGKKMNDQQREEHVTKIINQLGLSKVQDTLVGNNRQRGVSGGEKKRVNVGIELISDPDILFLDEPTSGLDSFQALSVCQALKELTKQGKTIITSIHQPRSSIVSMFDDLIIISEGNIVYNDSTDKALNYFKDLGYQCPTGFNQADHFLDLVSLDYRSPELENESRERVNKITQSWQKDQMLMLKDCQNNVQIQQQKEETQEYQIGYFEQFILLLNRQVKNWSRNKFGVMIKIVANTVFALIFGAVYSRTVEGEVEIQNKIGILFFICLNQSFSNIIPVLNVFISEKVTVQKERQSKAYSLISYFMAKLISELPFNIIGPVTFALINYYLVGFRPGFDNFLCFVGILIFMAQTASCLGLFFGTVSSDVEIGQQIAPPVIICFVLFSGVFINVESLPVGSEWISEISFIKWGFQAFCILEFKDRTYTFLKNNQTQTLYGNDTLVQYGFENTNIYYCLLRITYILIGFLVLAYLGLYFGMKKYSRLNYVK